MSDPHDPDLGHDLRLGTTAVEDHYLNDTLHITQFNSVALCPFLQNRGKIK
jgi:hypothetical protein